MLELIKSFESATGRKVPFELADPRQGDTVIAYADPTKIELNIGWKANFSLEESLLSAWKWEENLNQLKK